MTSPPQPDAASPDLHRRAFFLYQFASVTGGRLTRAESNKRIPKPIRSELGLTATCADEARAALVGEHLIQESVGRSPAYTITDAGRAWLRENERFVPLAPAKGQVLPPADAAARDGRVAWILLQLLDRPDGATAAALNKAFGPARLGINAATARHVRGELAVRRLVGVARAGRAERFTLTPTGLAFLAGLSFDGFDSLKVTGAGLARLLRAAGTGTSATDSPPAPPAPVGQGQLEDAVLDVFDELQREKFAGRRMVPIHEIRAAVAARYGADAASHARFDEVVLGLRRSKRLRLVSISDRSTAAEDQLRDSIFAVGETFFYAEKAHAPPAGG